jgi:hypothetical protein
MGLTLNLSFEEYLEACLETPQTRIIISLTQRRVGTGETSLVDASVKT